jgi:pre-rRNA-processing protein IPI3
LVSGSLDSIIHIWNLNQFQPSSLSNEITPKLTLSDHTLAITDIRIGMGSSKQCYVYTSALDHTVKIWKLNQGKLIGTLIFPSPVNCLSVDVLERKLSVGCQNNSIYSIELYKPCQGQSLLGFDSIFNEADLISVASMDPMLFSVLLGHESSVVDINYNWSSSQLISADQSGYLMVWDVDSKQRTNSYSIFKGGITNLKIFTLPPNLTNLNQLKSVHHPVVSLQRMIISDPNDKANTHLTILPKKVNFELFPPSNRTHINHFPNEVILMYNS